MFVSVQSTGVGQDGVEMVIATPKVKEKDNKRKKRRGRRVVRGGPHQLEMKAATQAGRSGESDS